jgi:GntR family transcriptional regulator, gluconate operon transcriptional repressor
MALTGVHRRAHLWETAADKLRSAILRGEIPVGHHLAEADLAATLGISRWPVRQALRQLQLESLVEVLPNGRTIVAGLSRKHIKNLYDARLCLERCALDLGISCMTDGVLLHLRELLDEMNGEATLQDAARFISLDLEFHEQFFVISGNRILSQLWKTLSPQLTTLLEIEVATVIRRYGLVDTRIRAVNDLHHNIVDAMQNGSRESAIALLEEHLELAQQILIEDLEQRGLLDPSSTGEPS